MAKGEFPVQEVKFTGEDRKGIRVTYEKNGEVHSFRVPANHEQYPRFRTLAITQKVEGYTLEIHGLGDEQVKMSVIHLIPPMQRGE